MKKLITIFAILMSFATQAQNTQYADNVWSIRNTSSGRAIFYTNVEGERCNDVYDITDPVRYVRLPQGNQLISFGEDIDDLTEYTITGPLDVDNRRIYANQVGFYFPASTVLNADITDSTPRSINVGLGDGDCQIEITSIHDVRYTDPTVGDGIETLTFSYHTSRVGDRLRVYIIDDTAGLTTQRAVSAPVRINGNHEYYAFDNNSVSGRVSVTVPIRNIGTGYRISLVLESDVSVNREFSTDVKPGVRITSIDGAGMHFITADNHSSGADDIWIDRTRRDPTQSSVRNFRWFKRSTREGDIAQNWSYKGGVVKKYTTLFNSRDHTVGRLRPYESVEVNFQRPGRHVVSTEQLNGPRIRFTWDTNAPRNNGDVRIVLNWRLELPPGWSTSRLGSRQIRLYSRDNGVNVESFSVARTNINDFLNGMNVRGGGITHRYADNDWELGVRFTYAGSTYEIKLVDNVAHGEHNGGRAKSGSGRAGGLYNGIEAQVHNTDTRGGSRGGSINFNDGW